MRDRRFLLPSVGDHSSDAHSSSVPVIWVASILGITHVPTASLIVNVCPNKEGRNKRT